MIVPAATTEASKSSCFSPPAKIVTWRRSPTTTGDATGSALAHRKSSAVAIAAIGTMRFQLDMTRFLAAGRPWNRGMVVPATRVAGITAPPR